LQGLATTGVENLKARTKLIGAKIDPAKSWSLVLVLENF
jgi:hypothetical protein